MADTDTLRSLLKPETMVEVEAAISTGEYRSASQVVQDAMDDWTARRKLSSMNVDQLRLLVETGIDSGPGIDAEEVFAAVRTNTAGRMS